MKNPINTLQDKLRDSEKSLSATLAELLVLKGQHQSLSDNQSRLIDENIQLESDFESLTAKVNTMCNDCIKQGSAECQDCPLY